MIRHAVSFDPLVLRFVLDNPQPDAAVCWHTLMLSRALLESDHLPAMLAHELGHLASTDGRLTAALNRLVMHPPPKPAEREPAKRNALILSDDRALLTVTILGAELLDIESIPYRRVGNQRRIRVADIRGFRERRERAEAGLRVMAEVTNESADGWVR